MAQIEKEPEDAKTEFLGGIVGPLSSAVIGLVSLAIAWAVGWRIGASPATPLRAMFVWLGYINLTLAALNIIPGYPLNGGRILRSILWLTSRDGLRATQRAAAVGKVIALLSSLLESFVSSAAPVSADYGSLLSAGSCCKRPPPAPVRSRSRRA